MPCTHVNGAVCEFCADPYACAIAFGALTVKGQEGSSFNPSNHSNNCKTEKGNLLKAFGSLEPQHIIPLSAVSQQ